MRIIGHIGLEEKLFSLKSRGLLNRTFLFIGGKDSGKTFIGKYFAAQILGDSVFRNSNPDFFYFKGNKGKYAELINDFLEACTKKPYGERIVVFFDDIDMIPLVSTNSLLKTLEEPPAKTTIIISAHSQESLLDTIISRSFRFNLSQRTKLDKEEILFESGIENPSYRLSIVDDLKTCMSKNFKEAEEKVSNCFKLFDDISKCKNSDLSNVLNKCLNSCPDMKFFYESCRNKSSDLEFQKITLQAIEETLQFNNKFLTLFSYASFIRNGHKTA